MKKVQRNKLSIDVTKIRELDSEKLTEVSGGSAGTVYCPPQSSYCYVAYTGYCATAK